MTIQGKGTIMIVDDEATIRENLQRFFLSSGYDASVASNGEDALDLARRRVYEVALLDVRMPGMSGIDLLRRVRADYPDIEVIMMTVVNDVTTSVECMKLGAYDYVLKPFNLDEMLIRVAKAAERRYLSLQVRRYENNLEKQVAAQAKQLRELMVKAVQDSIQAEAMSRELEAGKGKQEARPANSGLKEFAASVLQRFNSFSAKPPE
ncbi:MAG: response regulator [Dehalococcoidia bacterium]|nr:response regulator [Dehalococcoidia bacterium]